jgi:hypothetical protein
VLDRRRELDVGEAVEEDLDGGLRDGLADLLACQRAAVPLAPDGHDGAGSSRPASPAAKPEPSGGA